MPDGFICTPDIRDGERLQGFAADWTEPAGSVGRSSYRWKLVGNAVSVPAAAWIGSVLNLAPGRLPTAVKPLGSTGSWPDAAYGRSGSRYEVASSTWPLAKKAESLVSFLKYPPKALSERATAGFYKRLISGSLRYPAEFAAALEHHLGPYPLGIPLQRERANQIELFPL
jgi:DNA (cytosine-5)-methyltransferase 1